MFANNPLYKEVFHSTVHDVRFYMPESEANFHISRFIEGNAQNIYSASGATKEYLDAITTTMLDMVNTQNNKDTLRTDIAVLVNNIRVRLKHPIDEDCAIRMGAIYTFMDGENPDEVNRFWINKKMDMCKGRNGVTADPEMYSFFLHTGARWTTSWHEYPEHLEKIEEYLETRKEMLHQLQIAR